MIREPGGCFEQTSSSNYPNIMILELPRGERRGERGARREDAERRSITGYKLLTGYETRRRATSGSAAIPGHEALTAYGLMEFADMAKVYDVDRTMVDRTAAGC